MKYISSSRHDFNAICNRNEGKNNVMLCKILKSGKPGKPTAYELYGNEKTAQDVIARMEKLNPGKKWVEA